MHETFRLARPSAEGVLWQLRRNCSVTPRQLMGLFVSLCGISLGVSLFFWTKGATLVLPFAVVELLAVGTAFLVYARHATDGERIRLGNASLVVETEIAGRVERFECSRHLVRVAQPQTADALVELAGGGRSVRVGRYLRPELRGVLARELQRALQARV